jgi:signal transduction histidine kinase
MATAVSAAPPRRRSRPAQAWADFVYLTSGCWLGFAWMIALIVLISVGLSTSVVIVGLPLLAVTMLVWRWGADRERERAALVLGAPIPDAHRPLAGRTILARLRERAADPATWKDLAYLVLLGPVGILGGTIVMALWAGAVAAVASPAFVAAAPDGSVLSDLGGPGSAALAAGGVVLAVLTLPVTHGLAQACGALARRLLAPNERALLAARVRALETTRQGAVESSDATLRRIERDLHDGAQHRLAFIAMELGRARERLAAAGADTHDVDALLAGAHEQSKQAMAELRDLVRGIHPSVLTDRGLDAAVSGLAGRCAVPVAVSVELPRRAPAAIETAAYYVVAESLTNVVKHARAAHATVDVRREGPLLVVEVRDDGRGGARRTPGSGLEGLAQRVAALDGELHVVSPDGGPTLVRAELPCAS